MTVLDPASLAEAKGMLAMSEVQEAPQVALVTGATRGIGRAIAQALAGAGCRSSARPPARPGRRGSPRRWRARRLQGIVLDVTDGAALDAAIAAIVQRHGGLHVLVNNAGITRDMLSMRMKDEDWDAVLDTNLKAVFRASRAAIKPMMKQRYGRIVNITSVVGAAATPARPTTPPPRPAWPA